jgi:hypothetical protein
MTLNLLDDTFTLALQHIGSILESLKGLAPKYSLGLKVKKVESTESYVWVITGTICGFEHCVYSDKNPEWTYIITVESSEIFFKNGTTKFSSANETEFVPESNVQLID